MMQALKFTFLLTLFGQSLLCAQQLFVTCDTLSRGLEKYPVVSAVDVGDKKTKAYHVEFYPNGTISGVSFFFKGVEIGYRLMYFENGKLMYKCYYNWDERYLNLPLKWEVDTDFVEIALKTEIVEPDIYPYRNPKVGEEVTYYENGNIETICRYKEMIWTKKNSTQIKHGSWEYYRPDGKFRFRRVYDHNKIISQEWFY